MGHGPDRPYVSRREFLRRSGAVTALTLAATAGPAPWFWKRLAYAADAPVRQLHTTFGSDAATTRNVSWLTEAPVVDPFVELGGHRFTARTVQYAGYPGYLHHAELTGLPADTELRYAVGHAGEVRTAGDVIRTAPSGPAPFTFTAFGDQGVDSATPTPLSDAAFERANTELVRRFDPALHLLVGDLSYANGDQALWDRWFEMIEPHARSTPWMCSIGNHEIEIEGGMGGFGAGDTWGEWGYDAFRHRFAYPSNGDERLWNCFYAFRYAGVHFLMLNNHDVCAEYDTNRDFSGGYQARWVETELAAAASDPDVAFVVVGMHECAFSSSTKHGSDVGVQQAWLDLFATYDVDLVIQGHDHVYERTHLLRGREVADAGDGSQYAADAGTMFVVAGNGGSPVQEPFHPIQPAWSAKRQDFRVGTVRVQVEPDVGNGRRRLTLGEYWAYDGSPIEEGVVIDKPLRPAQRGASGTTVPPAAGAPATPRSGGAPVATTESLPVTGGGAAAVGAAALTAAVAGRVALRRAGEILD